jgi:competence protein ComEC
VAGDGRRTKAARVVLVAVATVMAANTAYWLHARFWHRDLRVTYIDVGQGNASLMELPGGPVFLIDGGGFASNESFDVGKNIVAPLLWRKKISSVDTLILSHPHSDHLNGLLYIARHFHVKEFWSNGEPSGLASYGELRDVVGDAGIQHVAIDALPGNRSIQGVSFDFLHPPKDFLRRKATEAWRHHNNNSLVVRATMGRQAFLFPGDIHREAERELVVSMGDRLRSTVLLSPHHGSATSSTTAFLGRVDPRVVVISCGWRNRFRYPHPSVLARYRSGGYGIWCTAEHGAVTVSTDGETLKVASMLPNRGEAF